MGTRADFYVGRGADAEWLGSIAWDGYPHALPIDLVHQRTEADWRGAVERFFDERDDVTKPEQGWPWPWDNSQTTDYAYAFDGGKVWASCFGHEWFDASGEHPDHSEDDGKPTVFPDMTSRKNIAWDKRSGLIIVRT